jgi:hypothetical protein
MINSLLVVSESGNLERVYIPITVYSINLNEFKYGKMFSVDSILMEKDEILFVIDGRKYKHGYFEIYLNPPTSLHL